MALVRLLSNVDSASLIGELRRAGADRPTAAAAHVTMMITSATPAVGNLLVVGRGAQVQGLRILAGRPEHGATWVIDGSREAVDGLASWLRERGGEAANLASELEAAARSIDQPPPAISIGRRRFNWGERTFVMGVVNVTPDSFSDGGRFFDRDTAIRHGLDLAGEGADLLDVGGESTRPGAESVSAEAEMDRVIPVVERLARETDVPISIDTTKAKVAEAALNAGASLVNDISGFRYDAEMVSVIARSGAAACAMHIQGVPRSMQQEPRYFDVVGEVIEYLRACVEAAVRAGVRRERLLVDPGIGFGKTAGHNLFLLRHLRQLRVLGLPVVVGTSRKSFIGKLTGKEATQRLAGTLASVAIAASSGADLVRVHDVAEAVDAVRVVDAIVRAREGGLLYPEAAIPQS